MANVDLTEFHDRFCKELRPSFALVFKEIEGGLNDKLGSNAIWALDTWHARLKSAWHVVLEFDSEHQVFDLWREMELVDYSVRFLKTAFAKPKEERPEIELLEVVYSFAFNKMIEIQKWSLAR